MSSDANNHRRLQCGRIVAGTRGWGPVGAALTVAACGFGCMSSPVSRADQEIVVASEFEQASKGPAQGISLPGIEVHTDCGNDPPNIVDIREADPETNKIHHDAMRSRLIESVGTPNTIVRLGPNVLLDFSELTNSDDLPPIQLVRCVTLTSVSSFEDPGPTLGGPHAPPVAQARTPQSLGPLLRFGPSREGTDVFLEIRCFADKATNDGVRLAGFRIHGPSFGQQSTGGTGIRIDRCSNIEISNMEIAGWGSAAIAVVDDPPQPSGDQGPADNPTNGPGPRISHPAQVKIFSNFLHHNQYPNKDGHANGYGVAVSSGAWAHISENVFDFNRHAISATGDSGGYDAIRNLALKGGGFHGGLFNKYTHMFDVHGTGCWWHGNLCGDAGTRFLYQQNVFQYRNDPAIKIRGRPLSGIYFTENVFPHPGLEDEWGDDAIHLHTWKNITIGPGNIIDFDSYGRYGVCDFDGDGIDDLFLPTRATWWYSSRGEFQWSYLNTANERLDQIRLGYFDNDLRCDVLAEGDGEWQISSGGTGPWASVGVFGKPLSEVAFGRFDPSQRDHRPGATRRTTHALWRAPDGQWYVTPLTAPDWQPVQRSSFPMNKLRFGDFTGDGVTDVLAVTGGRWAISESARSPWRTLNRTLSNDVGSLLIADLDNNNIDDLIRLERKTVGNVLRSTWWVSDDGRSNWRKLKTYADPVPFWRRPPALFGFAGRFGAAPGGGVLLTNPARIGRFFSEAESAAGASPDWESLFAY